MFSFPNPVNEVSARLVAAGVVLMCLATLLFDQPWIVVILAYGFVARVATGPTLSPLGQFVTRVLTPALPFSARPTPGPPKRFAQGIGATLSVGALVASAGFGNLTVAYVLVALILVAATLESVFGFCLGCKVFALLMRIGVVPESACADCNDIWKRMPESPRPRRLTTARRLVPPRATRNLEAATRDPPARPWSHIGLHDGLHDGGAFSTAWSWWGAAPSIANGLINGVDNINPVLLRAGKVLGAERFDSFRWVIQAAALPTFPGGRKQGWAFAWRSLLAGEIPGGIPSATVTIAVIDKDRDSLYRHAERDLADGERALASFPFAAVTKLPKPRREAGGPRPEKVLTGIRQAVNRYRPLVCTNRRVLIYDTNRTHHPRLLLAAFPLADVRAVEVRPGRFGGKVLVLALPGAGDVPFELGKKDLSDLDTFLANLG